MRFESKARSQRMSAKRRTLCAVADFWLLKVAYLLCEKWAQYDHRQANRGVGWIRRQS
jgi:hypothetical protein